MNSMKNQTLKIRFCELFSERTHPSFVSLSFLLIFCFFTTPHPVYSYQDTENEPAGLCDKPPLIQQAILDQLGETDCALVTRKDLKTITFLQLDNPFNNPPYQIPNDKDEIHPLEPYSDNQGILLTLPDDLPALKEVQIRLDLHYYEQVVGDKKSQGPEKKKNGTAFSDLDTILGDKFDISVSIEHREVYLNYKIPF